jgi:hypothetical protein
LARRKKSLLKCLRGPGRRATMFFRNILGSATQELSLAFVGQHRLQPIGKVFGTIQHRSGLGIQQQVDHIAKVLRIGPESDTDPISCWFDHILTTAVSETSPNKPQVSQSPPPSKLAKGIPKKDLPVRWKLVGHPASAKRPEARLLQLFGNLVKSLRMPRHQYHLQRWEGTDHLAKSIQADQFFGRLRASNHPHLIFRSQAKLLES